MEEREHTWSRWLLLLVPILVLWVAAILLSRQMLETAVFEADERARERLTLYRETMLGELDKFRYLPYIIARDGRAEAALEEAARRDTANVFLQDLTTASGASALYIMDVSGTTVAASNWEQPRNFLGENYSFRPYFQEAVLRGAGEYFAIGSTTGEPGFFFARAMPVTGEPEGVAAVKVDMTPLEKSWVDGGEAVFVTDENGIVFLSSHSAWRYHTLAPLSAAVRKTISSSRQYGDQALTPLPLDTQGEELWSVLGGTRYRHAQAEVGLNGWILHYLTPASDITGSTWIVWSAAGVGSLLYLVLLQYLRGRALDRASAQLRLESRTLRELNERLVDEVEERSRVERELRRTQGDLARAGKLAAVGQMSAAVAHELNQPLAAMRMFIAGARVFLGKNDQVSVEDNLGEIDQLQLRMAAITRELKQFSRPVDDRLEVTSLGKCIDASLKLNAGLIAEKNVTIERDIPAQDIFLETLPLRLEQVLVNLLNNGIEACGEGCDPLMRISATVKEGTVAISIEDNGTGIQDNVRDKIFDPFVSTKLENGGLGLGLSISYRLIKDLGGDIRVSEGTLGGARFDVQLPVGNIDVNPGGKLAPSQVAPLVTESAAQERIE
ncbi:MAG: ATP-binding protein [Stappiaceae bacterium]